MATIDVGFGQEEEFLGSMLGGDTELTMDVVRDVLFICGYDVEKSLNILLELSSSSMDVSSHSKKGRSFIQALSAPAAKKSKTPGTESQQVLTSLFKIQKPKSADQQHMNMNWSNIMASFRQGTGETETMMLSSAKGEDYKVLRQGATQHWDSMNSCLNKAAAAFSHGGKVYASVMSDQGRLHSKAARESQEIASRDIFESRNRTIANVITIDLHGQCVDEAMRFLKLHLIFGVSMRSVQTFKVITGLGKSLKQSVVVLLQKENIQWSEENMGMLVVKLSRQTKLSFSLMSDQSFECSNNSVQNVITIDLHGQHLKEGMRIVKLHLLFCVCLQSVQTLKVITGIGSQCSSKPTLKQSVANLLQRENIEWSEENRGGMLVVKLKGHTQLAFVESGRL